MKRLLALLVCLPVAAGAVPPPVLCYYMAAGVVTPCAPGGGGGGTVTQGPAGASAWLTSDPNNASYGASGAPVAMTVGTTYTAARGIQLVCTVAGNVSLQVGGVADVIPVAVTSSGPLVLPYAVTAVNSSGTTATCTYLNLN